MTASLLLIVGLAIGWLGRDLWSFAMDLLEIHREEEE